MSSIVESDALQGFETEQIDRQLARLLESHHFSRSARYPALLQFLVQQVLTGNAARLKERLVGIEVFHRTPDYDTNTDPVVRVTAAEVRKRLAQYYQEPEHSAELRIDLPIGSYIPRFLPARGFSGTSQGHPEDGHLTQSEEERRPDDAAAQIPQIAPALSAGSAASQASLTPENRSDGSSSSTESQAEPSVRPAADLNSSPVDSPIRVRRKGALLVWLTLALLLGMGLASAGAWMNEWTSSAQNRALHQLWAPMSAAQSPILFVIGDHSLDDKGHSMGITPAVPGVADTVLTHMNRRSQVPLEDLISLDRIHSYLTRDSKPYRDKGATDATLEDLRSGPVVLYAGFDNRWTVDLSQQLRFRLVPDLDDNVGSIVDSKNPSQRWSVNFDEPVNQFTSDYGIVARYYDPLLEHNVLLVAGIGSMGTAAASEFVTGERFASEIVQSAPKGWKNGNFEIVLNTPVVDGHAGPPRIVASTYW